MTREQHKKVTARLAMVEAELSILMSEFDQPTAGACLELVSAARDLIRAANRNHKEKTWVSGD